LKPWRYRRRWQNCWRAEEALPLWQVRHRRLVGRKGSHFDQCHKHHLTMHVKCIPSWENLITGDLTTLWLLYLRTALSGWLSRID